MSKLEAFLSSLENGQEKTASEAVDNDEALLIKMAHQSETIDAAATLSVAGEYLCKIANETENEILGECGETLLTAGHNMTVGLQKIAADNAAGAIIDMVETQDGISKVASVLEAIAVEAEDEDFGKMASAVIEVNNTLFDELAELANEDPSVAQYLEEYYA